MSDMIVEVKCLPVTVAIIYAAHHDQPESSSMESLFYYTIPIVASKGRVMSMRANTIAGRSRQFCILCFLNNLHIKLDIWIFIQ